MLDRILHFIRRHHMLRPGDRVAAAVSGGADSVALLHVLIELRDRLGVELAVAHFNHQLRGAESDNDQHFVEGLAKQYDLELFLGAADTAAEARQRRRNLEAVARDLRLKFFRGLVDMHRVAKVATGHTADDQAETVLARFLRGAGTRGLAGIFPVVNGWLIRPMLAERRASVRGWLQQRGVPWREDSSNRDLHFMRNRIRQHVLPVLEPINPRLVDHLAATAEVARDEEDFWRVRVDPMLAAPSEGVLKLSLAGFVQLHRAERRRLMRAALARSGHAGSPEMAHIDALLHLAERSQSGHRVTVGLVEVVRVFDAIEFRRGHGPAAEPYEYPVEAPGECSIPAIGTRLVFNLVGSPAEQRGYNLGENSPIDLDFIQNPLIVRNWRPGDAFGSPTGTGGRKLKRLLLGRRVPVDKRRTWPVVVSGGRIIWARGLAAPQALRMGPHSSAGMLIREEAI